VQATYFWFGSSPKESALCTKKDVLAINSRGKITLLMKTSTYEKQKSDFLVILSARNAQNSLDSAFDAFWKSYRKQQLAENRPFFKYVMKTDTCEFCAFYKITVQKHSIDTKSSMLLFAKTTQSDLEFFLYKASIFSVGVYFYS